VVVDGGRGHVAAAHGRDQRVAPRAFGAGHHQVQQPVAGGREGPPGVPVGDDDTVETPLRLEDVAQHRALGHRDAVDGVVRRHHGPDARLDGGLERLEVDLPQGARVDVHVDREPVGLGVVRDEVLDGRRDTACLDAADVRGAHDGRQVRVLRVALEMPSPVRGPVQVHGRREEHVDALPPGLRGQQPADALRALRVPGRRERRR
jgi:hypothetical protein